MHKENNVWVCEIELLTGEYLYKFLINGELPLYDPLNNLYELDENENLWSLLVIDSQKGRLLNPEHYHVILKSFRFELNTNKKYIKGYSCVLEPRITATIDCTDVTGIHGMTVAWYAPNNKLFEYAETAVCADDKQQFSAMFWLSLEENQNYIQSGKWIFRLFIDGFLVLEEFFSIVQGELKKSMRLINY